MCVSAIYFAVHAVGQEVWPQLWRPRPSRQQLLSHAMYARQTQNWRATLRHLLMVKIQTALQRLSRMAAVALEAAMLVEVESEVEVQVEVASLQLRQKATPGRFAARAPQQWPHQSRLHQQHSEEMKTCFGQGRLALRCLR